MSDASDTTQGDGPSHAPSDAAGRTHQGLVRPVNEDRVLCGRCVFAVADGLGGHPAGDVASTLAVQPLAELDEREQVHDDLGEELAEAVRRANRAVHADGVTNTERFGMGTTLTAAATAGGLLHLAHVGDSRAYLLQRGSGLRQLTTDHTVVAEAVAAGDLTAEQAAHHPARHTLNRVVGLEADVEVDALEPTEVSPGDRLLLCSDGLTEVLDDDDLGELLSRDADAATTADALVQATLERGAPDNVAVVVVYL